MVLAVKNVEIGVHLWGRATLLHGEALFVIWAQRVAAGVSYVLDHELGLHVPRGDQGVRSPERR